MDPSGMGLGSEAANPVVQFWRRLAGRYQQLLDESVPWMKARWSCTLGVVSLYTLRVALLGGWYIVTYSLGIFVLNLLIAFLSPQVDPELDSEDASNLPSTSEDEYKPFIRRLPEFKFWYSLTRACVIAFVCTFFPFLNIPVFWPILLLYFIALFAVTMKKQIMHMIKYKYVPWVNYKKPQWAT